MTLNDAKFEDELEQVAGLKKLAETPAQTIRNCTFLWNLCLHGLAEFEVLSKDFIQNKWVFKDFLSGSDLADDDDRDMRDLFNDRHCTGRLCTFPVLLQQRL
jgi:hypothetical protein